jgi:hypothetical protein
VLASAFARLARILRAVLTPRSFLSSASFDHLVFAINFLQGLAHRSSEHCTMALDLAKHGVAASLSDGDQVINPNCLY